MASKTPYKKKARRKIPDEEMVYWIANSFGSTFVCMESDLKEAFADSTFGPHPRIMGCLPFGKWRRQPDGQEKWKPVRTEKC